jgi:hypothetical protein
MRVRAVGFLRAAASETVEAETRPQLAAASGDLAKAIQAVGVDNWPRFVTDAQRRAHEKATLAAIQKSRQPVIKVSASAGASGSGTQLAMAIRASLRRGLWRRFCKTSAWRMVVAPSLKRPKAVRGRRRQ